MTGILAACTLWAMVYPSAAAEVPHRRTERVKGGDVKNVTFSAPGTAVWSWRMTAVAETDWEHIDKTQRPAYQPWVPKDFSTDTGYWISTGVTEDSPERHFQVTFSGLMLAQEPQGGGGGAPAFVIEARTDSAYFVLPSYNFACVGQEVTLQALNEEGAPVISNWQVTGPEESTATNRESYTFTPTEPGEYFVKGTRVDPPNLTDIARVTIIKVEIKAEDGESDPSPCIGVGGKLKYQAVVTPDMPGGFAWSASSSKLTLTNTLHQTVMVEAGKEANAENEMDELTVEFEPGDSELICSATHELSIHPVAPLELIGVNGIDNPLQPSPGFILYDNDMEGYEEGPYPDRPWLGTWLTFDAKPFTQKCGGDSKGILLTSQKFSWELKEPGVDEIEHEGQQGPMWFLDHFSVDEEGNLIPCSNKNGVWKDDEENYGMHISHLNVAITSLVINFEADPEGYAYEKFSLYDGEITVEFTAKMYHSHQVENPGTGFSSTDTAEWFPFWPENNHKPWRNDEPEWSNVEPIAAMQKTITISWEGGNPPTVNRTVPELDPGLNRYGRDEWGQ